MSKSKKWPQVLAGCGATLGLFGCGTCLSWTAPALPHMELSSCNKTGSVCDIPLSTEEASWVGSIMAIGAASAGPVAGSCMTYLGRKRALIFMAPVGFLGWMLLTFASNASMLYSGRFLCGFSAGSYAVLATVYTSEIADSRVRGALGSIGQTMCMSGVVFVYVLGKWVPWPWISGICSSVPIILGIWMLGMPESPVFLIERGKLQEAVKSLKWLRGEDADITLELDMMEQIVKESKQIGSIGFITLITNKVYLLPFLLSLLLMFFQQFSGVNAVTFYAIQIFEDTGSNMSEDAAIYMGMVQVLATIVAILTLDRLGRKILFIFANIFMSVSILGLGIFFFLKEDLGPICLDIQNSSSFSNCSDIMGPLHITHQTVDQLTWLPLTSLLIYIFMFGMGPGPVAWIMNTELSPQESKGLSSSICYSFNWFCTFLVTKFEPTLEEAASTSVVFFIFSGICALGAIFMIFFVPETKGRTPEDMRSYFEGKSNIEKGNENDAFEFNEKL